MSNIIRFGVSLENTLAKKFDERIKGRGYSNRSEAIRDLIRRDLVEQQWEKGEEVAGAIVLIYDHHQRALLNKITDLQHDHQSIIISSQHVHLDHHNCLEIVAVKGSPDVVKRLSDRLKTIKGVKHSTVSMSSTGKDLG